MMEESIDAPEKREEKALSEPVLQPAAASHCMAENALLEAFESQDQTHRIFRGSVSSLTSLLFIFWRLLSTVCS